MTDHLLQEIARHPLADATDLGGYEFPDLNAPGRFDTVRQALDAYPDKYVTGNMGLSGFNCTTSMRGFVLGYRATH